MLRHVVLLSFEARTDEADLDAIAGQLRRLPALIDTIRSYQVARDLGLAGSDPRLVVTADFDDVPGWEHYRDHPEHRRVLDEHIIPLLVHRTAAQFLR